VPSATARERAPAIQLSGIGKRFGWTWAVADVSLELERGTTLALVGPNGAGKTTLLRILSTLLRPSAGEGCIFGFPLTGAADAIRRTTGLLTDRGFFYGELTAAENLRFTTRMSGLRAPKRDLLATLERVGLARVAERPLRAFSFGMKKRLAIAQLLVRPIELALLDEPYAGLDSDGTRLVDEIVREFRGAGGTVVIASHQDGGAMREAERTLMLREGRPAENRRGAEPCSVSPLHPS